MELTTVLKADDQAAIGVARRCIGAGTPSEPCRLEGVQMDFSIDARPVASPPPGHFIDRDFLINETVKEAAFGEGQLRIT